MTSITASPRPDLIVRDLAFSYPGRPLFSRWHHRFPAGLTWVRGHNGCGKSTLLRLLGGALTPTTGQLQLAAIEAGADPLGYRQAVYWCAPDGIAYDHLKPPEFFGFLAGLYPRFDASLIASLVDALGLRPFLDQRIDQLSSGTQKKVAITAALAAGTPAVLLDEPLAALDRAAIAVVRQQLGLAAAQRERIWIVVSHEPLGEPAESQCQILDLPSLT